ncbi:MAG: SBBP repeat-containing protein, partial [Dehalococcoidia bacterium]
SLVYSTYLGGSDHEEGHSIAVNANANAFVTGQTNSSDFPPANPYDNSLGGSQDAFVTTLNAAGSGLTYSTYLGGSGTTFEQGLGIAVDGSGNAYVAGFTDSNDFPTANVYQIGFGGGSYDAFVTKIPFTPTVVRLSSFTARSALRVASLAGALAALGVGLVALGVGVLARRRWLVHVIP